MTSLIQFLSDLRSLGVLLSLDGERLTVNAPKGALTAEIRSQLADRKQEILAFLRESASPKASVDEHGVSSDLPLSRSQQRLWFLAQLNPDDPVYNIVITLRLDGELNQNAMEHSLRALVDRHESLRTAFYDKGGKPLARVVDQGPWKSDFVDLLHPLPEEAAVRARQLVYDRARKPFPLDQPPHFRATLLRVAERRHLLLLVVHHIVADGWSLGIIAKELSAFYSAFLADQHPSLAEISYQYRDYVRWEQESGEEAAARQLPFWLDRLHGTLPILELPGDRRRPLVQTFSGQRIAISIQPALAQQMQALCRDTGTTPFMLMLTAFKALLFRYTGLEDILVGSGTSNRQRQEFAPLVGFFVNNLVLRTDLSGNPSFYDLLARVKDTALSAYAHQDVPFGLLVEKLQPDRSLSQSPLIQAILTFQNVPMPEIVLPGLKATLEPFDPGIARADLSIEVWPDGDGYRCDFEYSSDIFDESTIRAMQSHYLSLLRHALADPTLPIAKIPLLSEEERCRILVKWNDTAAEYSAAPIHKFFEQIAETSPDAIAIRGGAEILTYRELNRRANGIAHYLSAQNLLAHSFIAVCAEGNPLGIAALLGILKAGHAYMPIDEVLPMERVRTLMGDAGATVLLIARDLRDHFAVLDMPSLTAIEDLVSDATDQPPSVRVQIDDPAYLMFTSGSTGTPKGVVVPHRGIVRMIKNNYLHWTPGDVLLQLAPMSFDASTPEIWETLLNAGTLVLLPPDRRNPDEIRSAIRKNGVTTLVLTTALFHFMVDENLETFSPLRQLLIGGDVLSPSHVNRLLHRLPHLRLINGYGPTENTTITCSHIITANALAGISIPIGKPVLNTRVFILDEFQQPVPVGVAGELYAAGDGLALGYWNAPAQTEAKFIYLHFEELGTVRAYSTGDMARYRSGGVIEFVGRKDKQVKLRGYRVEMASVEQAMLALPGVRAAVASVKKWPDGDRRLVAYLVPENGSQLDPQELRAALRNVLPPHEVPGSFLTIPDVPMTVNGKVDFEALDALPLHAVQDQGALRPPSNAIEAKLASLYAELLKVDTVSPTDDFFALGGHSLLVKQLIARVATEFQVKLSVASIFRNSAVETLAKEVEAALPVSAAKAPSPAAPQHALKIEHPLSRSQQRLWFLDQLEPGNPVYNISIVFRIGGLLIRDTFEEALKLLVNRHESLRTIFKQRDGSPYALVEDGQNWRMQFIDIPSASKKIQTAEVMHLAQQEAQKHFALDLDSVFRASLLRLGAEEHVAVLVMHHIISDGWSLGIISQELGAIYASLIGNRPLPFPHPSFQFRDFVAWEQKQSESSSGEDMQYWRQQLAGDLPVLELATDRPRQSHPSLGGGRSIINIPSDLIERLQKVSREHNATLFMVMLAAFNVLLGRYSGQDDILVGTPTANRLKTDFEGVVGFFVNNIVLRSSLSGDPDFAELIRRVQKTVLEAFEHQSVPFDQLVEVLQPERRLDRSPIFQVLFTLQNAPLPHLEFSNLIFTPIEIPRLRARYDLAVDAYAFEGKFGCSFEFNADIFDKSTIERMQQHFLCLLDAVASATATPIQKLTMLSGEERHHILEDWNRTQTPHAPYATVVAWFQAQAARSPDATAVQMGDRTLTYAQLDAHSTRMARVLRAHHVVKGAIVGFYLNRSPEIIVALLAILKAGAAYLPLDPVLPEQRLQFLLADSAVSLVITHSGLRDTLPPSSAALLMIDETIETLESSLPKNQPLEQRLFGEPTAEDIAYLIYTSGSTGNPKGTQIQHSALVNLLASMLLEPGLSSGDILVAITTLSFDIAALEIFGPLVCGATLVLASREQAIDPESLAGLIGDAKATVMQATPSTWRMLVDSGWMGRANLRMWCGGESLPPDLAEKLLARGRELWNLYGPTETTIWSAAHRVRSGENPILIGRPIANTRMYILDAELQPVPVGVPGELFIAGVGVARGYWRLPELTTSRFLPDCFDPVHGGRMYRTGDLARYRNDGQIQLLGRTDHQVKLRGHRIELGEIETVLELHPEVLQALVSLHQESSEPQLVAYIKLSPAQTDITQLRSWLRTQLPAYMIPAALYSIPEIPLTPNGKLDRKRLPKPTALTQESSTAVVAPRNRMEEQLAKIWSQILGVSQVSVRDNFFDVGGHSLLLIRVHAKLRQDLGLDVAVVDLFRYPTIESLAASLHQHKQGIPLVAGASSR
jgi:amino acid adenylation domain-containing protein